MLDLQVLGQGNVLVSPYPNIRVHELRTHCLYSILTTHLTWSVRWRTLLCLFSVIS